MATVTGTDPAARKRRGTERGGTETKRRDGTSPPAGKWPTQTLLGRREARADSARSEKPDRVLRAGNAACTGLIWKSGRLHCRGYSSLEEQLPKVVRKSANYCATLC